MNHNINYIHFEYLILCITNINTCSLFTCVTLFYVCCTYVFSYHNCYLFYVRIRHDNLPSTAIFTPFWDCHQCFHYYEQWTYHSIVSPIRVLMSVLNIQWIILLFTDVSTYPIKIHVIFVVHFIIIVIIVTSICVFAVSYDIEIPQIYPSANHIHIFLIFVLTINKSNLKHPSKYVSVNLILNRPGDFITCNAWWWQ